MNRVLKITIALILIIFMLPISSIQSIRASNEKEFEDIMKNSTNPTVAPYAGDGEVRLRVTAKASTRAEAEALTVPVIKQIQDSPVGQFIYGIDVGSIERALAEALAERGLTVATAE